MRKSSLAALVVAALVAASVGYLANELATGTSTRAQRWTVTSVAVADGFDQLITDGSSIFITGDGFNGVCDSAVVDPQSLNLVPNNVACDAVPSGEKFSVQYGRIGSLRDYWNCKPQSAAVRLVSVDPVTHKDVVGRIIMRVSGTCSHDYPLTVYAAGSMWVYDSSAGPSGHSDAIAQLSARTGALEGFATGPGIPAPVLAADDDGFYFAPTEFYQPGQGVYYVAPGSSRAQFLRSVPGPMAWLFGFGHTMYAALQHDYAHPCADHDCQLLSLDGLSATPKLINGDVNPGDQEPAGNAGVGIIIMRPQPSSYPTSFEVIRIDPSTGTTQLLARLPVAQFQYLDATAYAGGAFYVLMNGLLFRVALDPGAARTERATE
ncbi:MAG: hypothetical protein ACLP36_16870 [Acidimicrobiales bacterium]